MTWWQRVDEQAAHGFLDFGGARPDDPVLEQVAPGQLRGAVALYNRLSDRRLVWLSDEVGMGKTFVALGVVALLRHEHPDARVLFIVPSGRLQAKWKKEIGLFSRACVRHIDHRARTFQGLPARPLVEPGNLYELAAEMVVDPDRDVLATMSSFSFSLSENKDDWKAAWRRLVRLAPALPREAPAAICDRKDVFKRAYAAALNLILPTFDLVVCDESHNLRAGANHGAARNLTMAAALGGHFGAALPWKQQPASRVARLLCLTATPVERRYEELARQAQVFGLDASGATPTDVRADLERLTDRAGTEDTRKQVARRYIIRRLQELRPTGTPVGQGLTKNQYRREWRQGGLADHDAALPFASDREKLVVALVQKRVVQLLHETGARTADGTFLPSFQMGMLSSFESFSETISNKVKKADQPPDQVYDGEDQTADPTERRGVDSGIVDTICRSYRETFGTAPPHPKLDQVADQVAHWAAAGDKTLVFVRRVRTTEELADKIAQRLDQRLTDRVHAGLAAPLRSDFEAWLKSWAETRRDANAPRPLAEEGADDDDDGGADSFFAWFFRGAGKEDHQVAARLRRNTFQRPAHPWSIFFEDNHVLWLFGDDRDALAAWATARAPALIANVRDFVRNVKIVGPGHLYEAWQAGALELLASEEPGTNRGCLAHKARHGLYPEKRKKPWDGDPQADGAWLLREPLFTRLRRTELCDALWPGAQALPPADGPGLADREIRRVLLGSILRLGQPFVDLWIVAVNLVGMLSPTGAEVRLDVEELADAFLRQLRVQAAGAAHGAWHELTEIARHHRLLLDVNFADAHRVGLAGLPDYFKNHLSRQSPVLAVHGGSKSAQALTQFRMPGYPLAIVATDVLQEGVDLHTFCARVVHYGIAHTSSGTEQRTGRVDRIGSLVHRRFDPDDDVSRLQVHYPHLHDTIEPLQLHELYRRMDLFLRLVHDGLGLVEEETSRVSLQDGMQQRTAYPAPPRERLETAFDVLPADDLFGGDVVGEFSATFADDMSLESLIRQRVGDVSRPDSRPRWVGEVTVPDDRRQGVSIELRTRRDGKGAYLRVESVVGRVDLTDGRVAGAFLNAVARCVGVAAVSAGAKSAVALRCDLPVYADQDPTARLARAIMVVTEQADVLEQRFVD